MNTKDMPVTIAELIRQAPSIAAEAPESHVSAKYRQIRTVEVIPQIMDLGFVPVRAMEARVLAPHRVGFQKHVVTFRREIDVHSIVEDQKPGEHKIVKIEDGLPLFELNITNSHDRTAAWNFYMGLFVKICTNGLVVPNGVSFQSGRIKHINIDPKEIIETTKRSLEAYEPIMSNVTRMMTTELSERQRLDLAEAALIVKYEDMGRSPIRPETALVPRRKEDEGRSLWKTFNVVQENLIRGLQRDPERRDQFDRAYGPSNPIQRMDRVIDVNLQLWKLAAGFLPN